jgi:predicted ATP-dependent protease
MLHRQVREAVESGKFHIYAVEKVDEVMELLSGMPAGEPDADGRYPEQSFNYRVQQRIEKLQSQQRKFARRGNDENGGDAGTKSDERESD